MAFPWTLRGLFPFNYKHRARVGFPKRVGETCVLAGLGVRPSGGFVGRLVLVSARVWRTVFSTRFVELRCNV